MSIEYIPELSKSAKDSLLRFETYTIPGGDSMETEEVVITDKKADFIQLSYGFTTGQRGFFSIELRMFKKNNGALMIVYAKYGGAPSAFDQHTLLTFDYSAGRFKHNKNAGLPETIPATSFLKEQLSDSLKKEMLTLSSGYNLYPDQKNTVEYFIDPQTDRFDQWIKTSSIHYAWNGNVFVKQKD